MGLFGSSSPPQTSEEVQIPTRTARKECWSARDDYYGCLTSKSIVIPPGTDMSDGRGQVGKLSKEEQQKVSNREAQKQKQREEDPCKKLRDRYEGHCVKSWVRLSTSHERLSD